MTPDVAVVLWLTIVGTALVGFICWFLTGFLKHYQQRTDTMSQRLGALNEQAGKLIDALQANGERSSEHSRALADALENAAKAIASSAPPASSGRASTAPDASQHPQESPMEVVSESSIDRSPEPVNNDVARTKVDEALKLLAKPDVDYPGNLLKARDLLLPLADGTNGDVYTALSETLFWLGDMSTQKAEQEKYHGEGVEHGKTAVALAPDSVAANLWFAANMGSHGVARGIMSSLFYLGDIEKHGKKAMELDKNYFHGAPLRLMGRFYHQCPGWPIGSGDKNKAIKILEEAVSTAPEFFLNGLYLAEVLIEKRKKSQAKKVLEDIVNGSEPTVMPSYQERVRAGARKMMSKV